MPYTAKAVFPRLIYSLRPSSYILLLGYRALTTSTLWFRDLLIQLPSSPLIDCLGTFETPVKATGSVSLLTSQGYNVQLQLLHQ